MNVLAVSCMLLNVIELMNGQINELMNIYLFQQANKCNKKNK